MPQDQWYEQSSDQVHSKLFELVDRLTESSQASTYHRDLKMVSQYMGRDLWGFHPGEFQESYTDHLTSASRVRLDLNVSRSAVDTSLANICLDRPRIQVVPSMGNWDDHLNARILQRYIDGLFQRFNIYELGERVMRDAEIMGSGLLDMDIDEKAKDLLVEWTPKWQYFVDEQAYLFSPPREIYRQMWLTVDELYRMYASKKDEDAHLNAELKTKLDSSLSATQAKSKDSRSRALATSTRLREAAGGDARQVPRSNRVEQNLVEISVAFRKATNGKKNGRLVVSARSVDLVDIEHDKEEFRFVKLDWNEPVAGYWGQGMVEEGLPLQDEISAILASNQRAMHLGSKLQVIMDNSVDESQLPDDFITNEDGHLWPKGVTIAKPDVMSAQQLGLPFEYASQYFNIVGTSKMEAFSEKPSGNLSGKALDTLGDIASRRYALKQRGYERFILAVAQRLLKLVKEAEAAGITLEVGARTGSNTIERTSLKGINLPEESFTLEVFPVSKLPKDPPGRLNFIQQLIGMGALDPALGWQMLDMPDLESAQNIKLAPIRYAQWVADEMMYHGRVHAPDPIEDLNLSIQWVASTFLYAKMHGAEAETLDKLAGWKKDAEALLDHQTVALATRQAELQAQIAATLPGAGGDGGGGLPGAPGGLDGGGGAPPVPESEPAPLGTGGAGVPPGVV